MSAVQTPPVNPGTGAPANPAPPPSGAPANPAPPPSGAPANPAGPWYQGASDEMVGRLQNRGWQDKPANEVALLALQAHAEAEKFIGAPADQLLRLPKDANDPAWKQVHQRLGAPADKTGYDFSTVKRGDGTDIDQPFKDFLAQTAANLNLPKDTATRLAAELVKHQETAGAGAAAEKTALLQQQRQALAQNWGPNVEANMFVAKQAAAKLGVTPDQVAALEGVVGYDKVMEMFRSIGSRIGEDRFIGPGTGAGGTGVMTREQAAANKSDLMKDTAWTKRYLEGGREEQKQMEALNRILVGDDTDWSRTR